MWPLKITLALAFSISISRYSYSQEQYAHEAATNFPDKLINKISSKVNSLEEKIIGTTEKSIKKLQKQERKIQRKLYKIDSSAAQSIFNNSKKDFSNLINGLKSPGSIKNNRVGEFLPYLDSLKVSLKFIEVNKSLISNNFSSNDQVVGTLNSLNSIQDRLKYISVVQKYLKQRKLFLKEQLGKYGLPRELKKINKEIYYYTEKLNEYKSILNDPKKLKLAAFRSLNKIPSFREFFEKNSFIGSVFDSQQFSSFANTGTSAIPDISGLQSRSQVEQIVNSNLLSSASSGSSINQDVLSQRLSSIKDELNQLKNKNSSWDENAEMPDFKPNEMRSKSFLNRLEFGANIQFDKANTMLPSTTSIGAQVAYKFHQNGSLGIGGSYKLGYGNIRNITISHQGIGFRSFLDYKVKRNFFVNGGFEYNYNAAFKNITELQNFNAWQKSGLIGISKKYKVSKKLKGNLVILYDFLHNQHIPVSQPIIFRLGYNF